MPRVTHFPSSGDRWAFVATSCPTDYFLKRVLTVHLEKKGTVVLRVTEKGKKKKPQVTWGHRFLKQIKTTYTWLHLQAPQ